MPNPETNNPRIIDHVPSSDELAASRERMDELEEYTLTPGAYRALGENPTKSIIKLNMEHPYEGPVTPYKPENPDRGTHVESLMAPDDDLNAPARPASEVRAQYEQLRKDGKV